MIEFLSTAERCELKVCMSPPGVVASDFIAEPTLLDAWQKMQNSLYAPGLTIDIPLNASNLGLVTSPSQVRDLATPSNCLRVAVSAFSTCLFVRFLVRRFTRLFGYFNYFTVI